ncbi:MAG TPA: hypothetical protein VI299_18400, partial [Polyangiales bacterium]
GFDTGNLITGRLSVTSVSDPWWGWWGNAPTYVHGTRALITGTTDAAILDISNVAAPTLVRTVPLYAPAYHTTSDGNTVLLSLGMNGVQRIEL